MNNYLNAVSKLFKDWKVAVPVVIFTIARIVYGWAWFQAGLHKLEWLSDGKLNSEGMVKGLAVKLAGPEVTRFDPLHLNNFFAWITENVFLSMPAVTDFLVVAFEILVGVVMILGFKVFWGALVATFLNLQFLTAGSSNNFGYIWTNLAFMKWAKYAEAIGVDGFLRVKNGKEII